MKRDPLMVFFSTSVYRLFLSTYPLNFQHEYAACMAQVFRDCSLRAYQTRGFPGMLSLWRLTLVDYLKSAAEEYTEEIMKIQSSHIIRLSGGSFILGIATLLLGLTVHDQIWGHGNAFDPFNFYSRPIDKFFSFLPVVFLSSAMLFLTISVAGLYLRLGSRVGVLGKVGLELSFVGGILTFATCVAGGWSWLTLFLNGNQVGGWWLGDLATAAFFLLFGGIFIFGLELLKLKLFRKWNLLPLSAGSLIPLRIIVGVIQEATAPDGWVRWRVNMNVINITVLTITSISLIGFGCFLLFDKSNRLQQESENSLQPSYHPPITNGY